MSTETSPSGTPDTDSTERYEKEVAITAYGAEADVHEDAREFIEHVLGDWYRREHDRDLLAWTTTDRESLEVRINATVPEPDYPDHDWEIDEALSLHGLDIDAFTREFLDEDGNTVDDLPDWLTVEYEEYQETEYDYSFTSAIKHFLADVTPDEFPEFDYELNDLWGYETRYKREVADTSPDTPAGETEAQVLHFSGPYSSDIGPKRVKTHQAERSPDNRYMAEQPERWAIETTVSIEASSAEELEAISEATVPLVHDAFAGLDAIELVRLADCTTSVTKTGECYDL